ncbi:MULTISPECIES: phospho-N-acetylmuramoyl-pentapeptide-transferase [Peptostreptococcus]|jgi:phospho-N-acetylmuramoyl-pentapeptide-transferase|uniref:Phospho-N-acetylmuramoyl-pentapeptide-transferase n=2 Tax=Peptostreptococcus anaerobius TaxID=1261 RepID=D3MRY2_9FIRM|nr:MULTISPECIES: phospho-N-acetylmuramoyl-pentapeptide-transferase [Peptostreptococcus]EFD05054.1 phospho-N-acetylmuramoyl-pentapeptide-transferase [Peptostreptococcus anaerobius 653-L]EKX95584.1 phospho-N-acetylmuramoyl-pentapeptide-transferase [Peptostreptococcus anaerobius VPI 4330 = DSM 2949]KXI13570.1 phospho-N-acetylmuramoyl-pentapeptide-transferase [Peptostreptococcus anaerobius]MBS5596010.1 phospho-N-acetylmuramoyl-pentapeptide-transferase [Peptostreptococcus sp.]MDB8849361.1 phospho-N
MIGFRSIAITVLMSYILVMVMGPFLIPVLHKMKFGQTVRDDGPQSHLKKNGTPTMGGVMFMVAITAVTLLRAGINANVLMALLCMLGFGLIGLMDDLVKIKMTRSLGLTAKQKILLQVILAFAVSYYQYKVVGDGSQFIVPFVQAEINIGIAYIPFMMIVVLGTVNAVNLTDGLDGLASGITAIVALFFTIFAFIVVQNVEISQFAAATLGACIGFMWFNVNPAKVFMGDTGSMALGGAVTAFALFTNSALLIPIVGGIYFAEALSVIIQVLYFKKTRKRVFKMAPLHHHYEQCGWPETKVVFIFWLVAALLAIIGVVAMF